MAKHQEDIMNFIDWLYDVCLKALVLPETEWESKTFKQVQLTSEQEEHLKDRFADINCKILALSKDDESAIENVKTLFPKNHEAIIKNARYWQEKSERQERKKTRKPLNSQNKSKEKEKRICPFHDDHNPSLVVYENETFFCFGCHAYGNTNVLEVPEDEVRTKKTEKGTFYYLKKTKETESIIIINPKAEQLIKDKKFFSKIIKETDKTIVGEDDTKKTILLIALGGKLTSNAESTSINLIINDESGAGKDFVTRQILKLLPDVVSRKRISEKVLSYWHNAKYEPDWTWDDKIFYIEDITNSVLNSDVYKVFSSNNRGEKAISTVLIKQVPVDIEVVGKPVMLQTIAYAQLKNEGLRRQPMINLNITESQTKLILERKAKYHMDGKKPEYDQNIKDAILLLKPVKVRVPFADKLVSVLNTKHIIVRTHFDRFIDYISFSTSIHQYQRETDVEGFLLATKEDYEIGREALIKTTSNVFCIPLSKNQQKILDIIKKLPQVKDEKEYDETLQKYIIKEVIVQYSVSDLEPKVTFISDRTLRDELDKLTDYGFLAKDKTKRSNSDKPVMVYRVLDVGKINVPFWQDSWNVQKCSSGSSGSNASIGSNSSNAKANEVNEAIEVKNSMIKNDISALVLKLANVDNLADAQKVAEAYGVGFEEALKEALSNGEVYEPKKGFLAVL